VAASLFATIGGVGGALYMAYFAVTTVVAIVLLFYVNAFYLRTDDATHQWGFTYDSRQITDTVCDVLQCAEAHNMTGNLENSILTFSSFDGLLTAISILLSQLLYSL